MLIKVEHIKITVTEKVVFIFCVYAEVENASTNQMPLPDGFEIKCIQIVVVNNFITLSSASHCFEY